MINKIQRIKGMKNKRKIVMLTAYDFPMAKIMDGIVDMILVGDSMGMVVLGYENTKKVTMRDILRATESVAKGAKNVCIVGDMPYGSFARKESALKHAKQLQKAGAHGVKIEGEPETASFLVKNGISVMGHIGLTPQTITNFKVQGKEKESAKKIIQEAKVFESCGCFSLVIECVPEELGKKITESVSLPTIGIGAGKYCDGQVLVTHDMLGLFDSFKPKFVKRYAQIDTRMKKAFEEYAKEVRLGKFPDSEHVYH